MTRIDHAKEARRALRAAAETPSDVETVADPWILSAQVHATLALVEQQRIANLIALWQGSPVLGEYVLEGTDSLFSELDQLNPEIAAALGIGVSEPYTPGIQDLLDAYTYVMGPSEAKERRETAERILAAHDAETRKDFGRLCALIVHIRNVVDQDLASRQVIIKIYLEDQRDMIKYVQDEIDYVLESMEQIKYGEETK